MNSTLSNSHILIKPSNKLCGVIKQLSKTNMPIRVKAIASNKKVNKEEQQDVNEYVTNTEDISFLSSIDDKLQPKSFFENLLAQEIKTFSSKKHSDGYLQLDDLLWLQSEFEKERANGNNIYMHELLDDCSWFVPENEKVERNPELEKRCIKLKDQQDNLRYRSMTKNVDTIRIREPQETISYQLKQMNKQLIAVGQFIISVLAGFAFGFIGVELLVGRLDFGFRLLLGIMCALIIALAELYFLAKQLVDE